MRTFEQRGGVAAFPDLERVAIDFGVSRDVTSGGCVQSGGREGGDRYAHYLSRSRNMFSGNSRPSCARSEMADLTDL